MKIEMVLPSLAGAGMETMVARMTRKLVRRGHDAGITCILAKGLLAAGLEADGLRVSCVPTPGVITNLRPAALATHIARLAPDVLHVHSGAWMKGAMAGLQATRPFRVTTAHGFVAGERRIDRMLDRAATYLVDRVVAVTEPVRQHLLGMGVDAGKICVVTNGIDTELFSPGPGSGIVRRRCGIGQGTIIVGCVARLETIKNHAMLIDGLALARSAGADCEVVLFGDGALRQELQAQAAARGVRERVHFWGFEARMHELYADIDVFALTSHAEGTSISMLEAMSSGVCCVATAVGGNVALLDDGAGVLVPAGNSDALARALGTLTQDSARRMALGGAARARAVSHFSDDVMIDRYEAIYAEGHASKS